jgi:hypothetical protein
MQMPPSVDEAPTAPDVSDREALRSSGPVALRWSADDTVPAFGTGRDDAFGAVNGTTMASVRVGLWLQWATFGFANNQAHGTGLKREASVADQRAGSESCAITRRCRAVSSLASLTIGTVFTMIAVPVWYYVLSGKAGPTMVTEP